LEEVGEALEEIEEERRGEVHGANVRREQYNDREKDIQVRPEVCLVTLRLISVNSALKTSSLPPNTLYRPWASLAKVLNPNSTT